MVENVNAIQTNNTNYLVKKADYDTKIKGIDGETPNHDKYITTGDFNKFSRAIFDGKLTQGKLAITKDINNNV